MKNNNNYNERDIRNGINSLIANYIIDDINQFELSK